MIHHHFYKNNVPAKSSKNLLWNRIENFTMKLRNKKKLLNLFSENGVRLVLHGHSHEIKEYTRKGIKFLNAGGSVENETPGEAGLFIIEIKDNEQKINFDLLKNVSPGIEISNLEELLVPSYVG
jgi:predicted phosphodiesterase